MKTGNTAKGSRNRKIGTLEMNARGNIVLNLTKFAGTLQATAGRGSPKRGKSGFSARKAPMRGRRAATSQTAEASH